MTDREKISIEDINTPPPSGVQSTSAGKNGIMHWLTNGDLFSARYFDQLPEIGRPIHNIEKVQAFQRQELKPKDGRLIQCKNVQLDEVPALFAVVQIPVAGESFLKHVACNNLNAQAHRKHAGSNGFLYIASITIPSENQGFMLKYETFGAISETPSAENSALSRTLHFMETVLRETTLSDRFRNTLDFEH